MTSCTPRSAKTQTSGSGSGSCSRPSAGSRARPGEVQLEPRAMELLVFLADHAGERGVAAADPRRGVAAGVRQRRHGVGHRRQAAQGPRRRRPGARVTSRPSSKRGYRLLPRPLDVLEVVAGPGGAFRVGDWLVEPSLQPDVEGRRHGRARPEHDGRAAVPGRARRRAGAEAGARRPVSGATSPSPTLAIDRRIAELEEALGGGATGSRYIEAVPERGFRLAAAVGLAQPGATVTPFPGVRARARAAGVRGAGGRARAPGRLPGAGPGRRGPGSPSSPARPGPARPRWFRSCVRRAQDAHGDLVAAVGVCSAQTGIGDAYAPWRQLLALLTGDVESGIAGGSTTAELARRLWRAAPLAAEAVAESGRDLVGTLIPGAALLARAEAAAPPGASWLGSLRELVQRKASLPPDAALQQAAVFMQVARVLGAVAAGDRCCWCSRTCTGPTPAPSRCCSTSSRELASHRILVLGTYRPTDVALGRGGERHPLEAGGGRAPGPPRPARGRPRPGRGPRLRRRPRRQRAEPSRGGLPGEPVPPDRGPRPVHGGGAAHPAGPGDAGPRRRGPLGRGRRTSTGPLCRSGSKGSSAPASTG